MSYHAGVLGSGDRPGTRAATDTPTPTPTPTTVWPSISGEVLRWDVDLDNMRTMSGTRVAAMVDIIGNKIIAGEASHQPIMDTFDGRDFLRMDGNSRMMTTDSGVLAMMAGNKVARSMAAAVRFGSAMPSGESPIFGTHNAANNVNPNIFIIDAAHNAGMPWHATNGPNGESQSAYPIGETPPPTSKTSLLMMTSNASGTRTFFIDNRQMTTTFNPTVATNVAGSGNTFSIGAWHPSDVIAYANEIWIGAVFLFNKALSQTERESLVSAKNAIYGA